MTFLKYAKCSKYFLLLMTFFTYASNASNCDSMYYNSTRPILHEPQLLLCFEGYEANFNIVANAPSYSAEYITAERVTTAKTMHRKDAFHPELQVPKQHRITPKVYSGSGYDKGHLAPSGDMETTQAQYESFSMANMVPQSPNNNRIVWREMEEAVRNYAETLPEGEGVYVVTGAVFSSEKIYRTVLIPELMYKAIYVPSTGKVGVYVAKNDDSKTYNTQTLYAFKKQTGIDVFPSVPKEYTKKLNIIALKQ